MKVLVLLSLLCAASQGKTEVDGFFKEESHIPGSLRRLIDHDVKLGIDCTPPTNADCRGDQEYHPWPCDCHKYYQCVNGELIEHDCVPYSLIFNPLTENCELEETAPPGLCQDTPTTAKGDTTTPIATTPEPATTEKPTPAPTTTPRDCWICDGCTCDASVDLDGFFKPHPDNCHWYYQCVHNPDDPECEWSSIGPYDCGDWAFNPEQASCAWPELVPGCN